MNNSRSLLLFSLLMMISIVLSAQSVLSKKNQSKNSVEHSIKLNQSSFFSANSSYYSKSIKVESDIATPFIMLSGYVEQENFKGQLFFRIKVKGEEKWSIWKPFQLMTEGITPNRTVYIGGELDENTTEIFIKSFQELPSSFKLRLFYPGHSHESSNAHTRGEEIDCNCAQPDICGRACWCPSGDCPIDTTPEPTIASHFIVHHSAGQTTSSDFAAVVRSYYDFHTVTNGWDDIGYNWLIDGNGIIYEGRGQGLQGAHFSCMNQKTIGICVIGNYENATPTVEAINALQDFIAWGACEEDIDVLGMDFHPNSDLNLDNISGHRDGNDSANACSTTVCPGENLYNLLPTIRDEIAAFPCLQDNSTSINELLENEKIDIFPNPNTGKFQIQFENVKITDIVIYNSIGQKVGEKDFENKMLKIEEEGLYHLQFHLDDGRVISKKVIVLL